jgi:hypothetical protein
MRFCLIKREEGSVTPLILGFAIIIASIIATLSDITYLGNAHLSLKSEGQRVLADALRNVSSVGYYQGNSEVGRSVPIDCQNTYFNIMREVQETQFYLSDRSLTVRGYTCENSWIEFEISAKVSLPFLPRFLADVNPTVSSLISGGSRYFSD